MTEESSSMNVFKDSYVNWAIDFLREGKKRNPSLIALFDKTRSTCVGFG